MAMAMLKWPETRARELGRAILELRDKLCLCSHCNSLSDCDPCRLCADPGRSQETLCVLAEWDSLLAMEEGGFYRGGYFILGGLLAPLDGVEPDGLELNKLRERLRQGVVRELILGLGATIDAENTASYLRNLAHREFPGLRVTRLAQGIPLGAEVRYMDKETLRQSLAYRQDL